MEYFEHGRISGIIRLIQTQADKYQKRMQELAPTVKDMEHLAAKFSDNPEQVFPEARSIESGKSYREKKAKPLIAGGLLKAFSAAMK